MSVRECVQCIAETRAGKRCKKHTCTYSEFCDVHTKKLFDLAIKQSAIAGSGKGLFTMVEIPKNTRIAQYTGQVKTDAEYGEKESGYGISIPGGKVIDAYSTQHGIARYANDCRSANIKKGECKGSNARFSSSTRDGKTSVWLTSTKRIKAGGEIFVSYGRGYWADGATKTKTTKTTTTVYLARRMARTTRARTRATATRRVATMSRGLWRSTRRRQLTPSRPRRAWPPRHRRRPPHLYR